MHAYDRTACFPFVTSLTQSQLIFNVWAIYLRNYLLHYVLSPEICITAPRKKKIVPFTWANISASLN